MSSKQLKRKSAKAIKPHWPTQDDFKVPDFPTMILLNLTNICPLSCLNCPLKELRKMPDYKPEMMGMKIYKKIINEVAKHPKTVVKLVGDGEPLVLPHIVDMIKYSNKKKVHPTGIISNGFLLTEKLSRELLKTRVDYIDFSLDAATKKVYDRVRLGSDYVKVMSNIELLLKLRRKIQGKKPKTKILVNIIDQPLAHKEIPLFFKKWEQKVDRVYVRTFHSVAGLIKINRSKSGKNINRWPCRLLWERLDIDPDGSVNHCSISWYRKPAVVGNINKETIKEIWGGKKLQQLRYAHLIGKIPKWSLCFTCKDWQAFRWGDSSAHYLLELTNH